MYAFVCNVGDLEAEVHIRCLSLSFSALLMLMR